MDLVEKKELNLGWNNIFGSVVSSFLMWLLGINRANKLYRALMPSHGVEFIRKFSARFGISYTVDRTQLSNIPERGGCIVIANHPCGALDGVLLLDMLSGVRSDVKFMGNYMVSHVKPLEDFFIEVDPFNSRSAKNIGGLRRSRNHIESGGMLVIFPAGEVSTYQKGFTHLTDREWPESAMRFIRGSEVPVIPIYIDGRNSLRFHIIGMIHPMFRTALLPRELLNKRGKRTAIAVGAPLQSAKMSEIKTIGGYSAYLRANVYLLKESLATEKKNDEVRLAVRNQEKIAEPVPADEMAADIERLRGENMLFTQGSFSVFLARPNEMPAVMREIARLREITFRQVGEGSSNSIDTDSYDEYYRQLFVWDNTAKAIVGAYRIGFGAEILEQHGMKGFYTNSLFEITPPMKPIMEKTIELGRSFIVREYQRRTMPLMLLWKGILYVLLNNRGYRYLMGPVSISAELRDASKTLIMGYIKRRHFDYELAKYLKPRTGAAAVEEYIDPSHIESIYSVDALDKLIVDMETKRHSLPVLLRRYIYLGGNVMGFNIDHSFRGALDALMILDLTKVPHGTVIMLSKDIGGDAVSRLNEKG